MGSRSGRVQTANDRVTIARSGDVEIILVYVAYSLPRKSHVRRSGYYIHATMSE